MADLGKPVDEDYAFTTFLINLRFDYDGVQALARSNVDPTEVLDFLRQRVSDLEEPMLRCSNPIFCYE